VRAGEALRLAGRDLFANSWRLVPVNAALGLVLAVGVAATLATPVAAVSLVLAGPLAAALFHCAVTLARTESLTLGDAASGLRRHWRRGLGLAAIGLAIAIPGTEAVRVYLRSPLLVPLAFFILYLLSLLGIYGLILWTLAIADPERPLSDVARRAAVLAARRPGGTLGLGMTLLLVNLAGLAAGVMPFLTVTLAFTFVAAARFVIGATEA
jgi:hypothetical protein